MDFGFVDRGIEPWFDTGTSSGIMASMPASMLKGPLLLTLKLVKGYRYWYRYPWFDAFFGWVSRQGGSIPYIRVSIPLRKLDKIRIVEVR